MELLILCSGAIIRVNDYSMLCALSELPHYLAQTYHALSFSEVY